MRVLVTGGAGFIGSHLVDRLIERGDEVVVIDNLSQGRKENINPKAKFYKKDIRDSGLEKIFRKYSFDVLFHAAAQVSIRASIENPPLDASINIQGSLNLFELSRKYGVRKVVYTSSVAVYGEPQYLPCDEDHPIAPLSPYGVTKSSVEEYLYVYRTNYDIDYSIIRYPNVYGPRQSHTGEAGVIAIFSSKMLKGERVVINGSGDQERDFLFIDDAIDASLSIIDLPIRKGHIDPTNLIFNLGTGKSVSVNNLFEILSKITNYTLNPLYGPPRKGEIYQMQVNATRVKKQLGWEPKINLEEGLQRTVEWFKTHRIV